MPRTDGDRYDLVVVGSGVAGLVAALTASSRGRVAVVTKGALDDGCTRFAQGGLAAAVAADDSPGLHAADTLEAGRGLCDEEAVRVLCEEAPRRVHELLAWGVRFDASGGSLRVGREAAHSRARILHSGGDATGLEMETALVARLLAAPVDVYEHHLLTRLLVDGAGACTGVEVVDTRTAQTRRLAAGATVVASGGAGRLWLHTTNPQAATGDGIAAAFDAGAEVRGMEFVQFHPTALALPGAARSLVSEAVRGEGAHVVDADGRRFLLDADPRGELAPRDVVSQAIWARMRATGADEVYLDCRPIGDRVSERFPSISATLRAHGLDMATTPVPIAPAAHYLIGGIRTDVDGATSVPALYACGEAASTGVHGANRLASNSLLESVVFAARAADTALRDRTGARTTAATDAPAVTAPGDADAAATAFERLRAVMWDGCGIVRDAASLRTTLAELGSLREERAARGATLAAHTLRTRITAATLVASAALAREESRGAHLRSDFPTPDDSWLGNLVMQKDRGPRLDSHARPVH